MEVLDSIADDEGNATLILRLSNSTSIAGYSGVLSVDGNIFANGRMAESTELTGLFDTGFNGARVHNESLRLGVLNSLIKAINNPPGKNVDVLSIDVCLDRSTQAGTYALHLDFAELVDGDSSRSILPTSVAGTLTVNSNFSDTQGCSEQEIQEQEPCQGTVGPGPSPGPDPDPGRSVDFIRGDANEDGRMSISDSLMLRRFLFNGERPPSCMDAADANDDGKVNISDPLATLNSLFVNPISLPAPEKEPRGDPTSDSLDCLESS